MKVSALCSIRHKELHIPTTPLKFPHSVNKSEMEDIMILAVLVKDMSLLLQLGAFQCAHCVYSYDVNSFAIAEIPIPQRLA
jgi:hypothetical protein